MNPDTGEIKNFKSLVDIPKGWVNWNVDELLSIKNCAFRVKEININNQTILLKAISKKMTRKQGANDEMEETR